MRTRKLRFLSALLAVAMMFMLTPTAAFAEGSDTTGSYTVTVTAADTGDATKSAVQKALERTYSNISLDNVQNLTVKTETGVDLNKDDFAFMSGTRVTKPAEDRYAPAEVKPTDLVYLSGLLTLDLSGSTCENNMIPGRAFYNDASHTSEITRIVLPKNLERIGLAAFCGMTNLAYLSTSATQNLCFDGVKILGESMVSGDAALKGTLVLPKSLEAIGGSCFANSGIEGNIVIKGNLNIKDNADYAPSYKFPDCGYLFYNTNITSIKFESGIETIPAHVAANASALQSIKIPNTVKSIGMEAFYYSVKKEAKTATTFQKDIVIPESVESIGYAAFYNVGKVQNIIVENPNVTYELYTDNNKNYCFGSLSNTKIYLAKVPDNAATIGIWDSQSIHLNMDGGIIATDGNGNVTADTDENDLYIPIKEGYEFDGWQTTDNGKTYTAKWKKLYTVTFAYGEAGLTETTEQVAEGNTVTKPEDPKANGYKFEGWYKDKNRTEAFKFTGDENADSIANDTTIYAKWHKYSVNITTEEKPNTTEPDAKTYVDQPVEIDVNVTAGIADLAAIAKASLIFDDATAVEKVEVNGKELTDYTDIDIATLLGNTQPDQQEPQSIALLSEENANSTLENVPATATLSITFNKAGEHSVTIQLKDSADNTIATQTTQVKVYSKSEPAPEEKTAKLTFTDDCTAELEDGTPIESGKQVKAGEKVTLKLVESKVPEGMKFDAYVIDPIPADGKLTVNGTTATFEMTEKDTSVKVNFVTTDTEDSSWDAATIVTGVAIGAGTAVLAYHIGTEVYAEQILDKGVAIPRTRADVALTAWQLAGKPEVTIEGEPLSEAAIAQKWAVESGLMQNDADGSFNPDKKMSKLKALKVLDAAKKMG